MGKKSIAGSWDLKITMKLFSFGRQTVKEIMTSSAYCAVLVTSLCSEYYLPPRLSVTMNSALYALFVEPPGINKFISNFNNFSRNILIMYS